MEKIKEFLKDKRNFGKIILLLIIFLAAFLRLYRLGENPPSLNWDEISHGYNAYSILKTGKDEWGNGLPLIFRAYGDYKLPLYIYTSILPIALFGLKAFSIRFISALAGVGLVFLTYLITKKVTQKENFSLFASFLAAVSPWSLFVSRVALEANLAAFLFAAGVYFVLQWLENGKGLTQLAIFWGLALYTYNSARILVPLLAIIVGAVVIKKRKIRQSVFGGVLFLIFLIPFVGQLSDQTGKARFDLVTPLDQGTIVRISEKRTVSKLPPAITRIIYNRPTYFAVEVIKNYLSNLSPNYLFFRGGSHYQFSQPDHELLYLVTAPFLLLGILRALLRKSGIEKLIVAWFFLGFLPSAITRDAPHVLRSLLILPSPMILVALGLKETLVGIGQKSRFKGKLILVILSLAVLVTFARWWQDYGQIYPKAYSWAWQYGYQEAALFIKENFSKYDRIYFTKRYGEPHEFLLFYLKWNPSEYQNPKNKSWDYHANWYWVNGFDKFVFVNDWEIKYNVVCDLPPAKGKCLLVTSPGNFPKGWKKIKTINFLDGKAAFEILEP